VKQKIETYRKDYAWHPLRPKGTGFSRH
jgi:hypothetical protein